MNHFDYYTGEPTNGSPGNYGQSLNSSFISGSVQYSSDPNQRFNMFQQYQPTQQPMIQREANINLSPGYNGQPIQPFGPGMMNPPQSPYVNSPTGFQGYRGNPAFAVMQGNNPFGYQYGYGTLYQQPMYQDKIIHVDGFNPGSAGLFTPDDEQKLRDLNREMMIELEKANIERQKRIQGVFNNNGLNYYGSPYYSGFGMDSAVVRKYDQKFANMKQEAIDRRLDFNKRMSRLSHNYLGEEISDEELDKIYGGYSYTITGAQIQSNEHQNMLSKMVPVTNQNMYAEHHNKVKEFYGQVFNGAQDTNDFLAAQGTLQIIDNMEQEMHNRRNASRYYSHDAYQRHLMKAILERDGAVSDANQGAIEPADLFAAHFPTLANASQMMEDGTLVVKTPDFLGRNMTAREVEINMQESHYDENRRAFLESIYRQDV